MNRIIELFIEPQIVRRIKNKLPELFQLVELESQRSGKTGMQVGSLRENVLISLLIYKFGKEHVSADIPITTTEIDVVLFGRPISIKTKSNSGYSGVKLIWTVDAQNAREFSKSYVPACDMLFAHIIWGRTGALHYFPLSSQIDVFESFGNESYIKLPSLGTNPRGVEISSKALQTLVNHPDTYALEIEWIKREIKYDPYARWLELWQQD